MRQADSKAGWVREAEENIAYAEQIAARRYGEEAAARAREACLTYVYEERRLARNFADRAQAVRLLLRRASWQKINLDRKARRESAHDPQLLDGALGPPDVLGLSDPEAGTPDRPVIDGGAMVAAFWRSVARYFMTHAGRLQKPQAKLIAWKLRVDGLSYREIAERLFEVGLVAGETREMDEATVRQWMRRTADLRRAAAAAARAEFGLDN